MCGTLIQFDGMRGSIHRNDVSSRGWHVLETSQHIPDEEHGQLLLWADTIRAHTYRGCIPGGAAIGGPATLVSTSHAAAKPSTWSQALISTALAWRRCSSV